MASGSNRRNRQRQAKKAAQRKAVARRDGAPARPPTPDPATRRQVIAEFTEQYSGPIPSAVELQRYKDVDLHAPTIILDNFDKQSAHRRDLEKVVVQGSEKRAQRGQFLVAALLGIAVVGGLGAIFAGHDTAGATVAGTAIGGGALIYVVGGRPPKGE